MAQIFKPRADTVIRIVLAAAAALPVLAVGLGYAIMRSSYTTEQNLTREQPVPFSHEHHVGGLGLDCRYCHTSVENTRFAGMPPTETCMTCHSQLWTNAGMLAPVRASLVENRPLRWQRVHNLPGYVYFDHSVHVTNGIGCSTCHGAVDRMPLMRQTAPLTMSWCLDCHQHPENHLRPPDAIFDMSWRPPDDQATVGRQLMLQYHIDTRHLMDCSRCHR
ncbi:cytochrome c3 family protein [Microvirga massiliensis]|uniref:cytochrome c3 family protein n=1 Tax=Microvirga massiliensis TaxID=1033741 RepID=UPI00062B774B|nr:cytochrome c3 family protein [Microvirga massiliensis]